MSNVLKTALLLGALSALLLFIGESLGGSQGLVIGFAFAVVMNFGSYWFSDKIVLKMYRAREVGPGHPLYGIVNRLALRAGLPQPLPVYLVYWTSWADDRGTAHFRPDVYGHDRTHRALMARLRERAPAPVRAATS